MLKDRACPKGGWNVGNSEVFGVPLDPHPDFTAMALLALQGAYRSDEPIIATAFDYLHRRLMTSDSLYSLAWALLAMNTWRYPQAGTIDQRLNECLITSNMDKVSSRTLALVALALETPPCSTIWRKAMNRRTLLQGSVLGLTSVVVAHRLWPRPPLARRRERSVVAVLRSANYETCHSVIDGAPASITERARQTGAPEAQSR